MKKLIIFAIALAIGLLTPLNLQTARANSGLTQWGGVYSTGAIVTDGDCPIVVEKEILNLDLGGLTEDGRGIAEQIATAEYHFYNPSDVDVNVSLAFPFGYDKYKFSYTLDDEGNYIENESLEKFGVKVNGEEIESKIRYTYSEYNAFNGEKDINNILAVSKDNELINRQSQVKEYTYNIKGYINKNTVVKITTDLENTVLLIKDSINKTIDGTNCKVFSTGFVNTFRLAFIGETPSRPISLEVYSDYTLQECIATLEPKENEPASISSLEDYIISHYTTESRMSKEEYVNAHLDIIKADFYNFNKDENTNILEGIDFFESIMLWYEYELNIEAGERLTNSVTVPMDPNVNARYEPAKYTYTYLLSPAKCWANFGDLEIIINTNGKIVDSGEFRFTEQQGGYKTSLKGLPEGELVFSLSLSSSPIVPFTLYSCLSSITGALPILAVLMAIAFVRIIKRGYLQKR